MMGIGATSKILQNRRQPIKIFDSHFLITHIPGKGIDENLFMRVINGNSVSILPRIWCFCYAYFIQGMCYW